MRCCDCDCHEDAVFDDAMRIDEDAVDRLRHIAESLRQDAQSGSYGYFPGGDPRDFCPDEEVCTESEIAAWKAACEAWERGERPDPGGPHEPIFNAAGEQCGHITRAHYGMGTFTYNDPAQMHFAQQLDDWITQAREAGVL